MGKIQDTLIFGIKSSSEMLDAFTADLKGSEWDVLVHRGQISTIRRSLGRPPIR